VSPLALTLLELVIAEVVMQDEVLRMEFYVGHLGHRPHWPKLDENRATGMIYEADCQIAMAFRTGCSSGPDHRCYLYRRTGGRTGRRQLRLLVKARAGESRFCASCERHNWGGRLANARRSPRRRLRAVGQNCIILGCEGCPSAEKSRCCLPWRMGRTQIAERLAPALRRES
jgi:hypothetical protein